MKLTEKRLQSVQWDSYAEAIVATIHEPLLVLTQDFCIQAANQSFYKKFEIPMGSVIGANFFSLNEGKWDGASLRTKMEDILPHQTYFENFVVTLSSASGKEWVLALNGRQVVDDQLRAPLILVAMQDITAQKLLETKLEEEVAERTRELVEVNEDLRISNDNLKQFASIASHDLQEPLRKIKTFCCTAGKIWKWACK